MNVWLVEAHSGSYSNKCDLVVGIAETVEVAKKLAERDALEHHPKLKIEWEETRFFKSTTPIEYKDGANHTEGLSLTEEALKAGLDDWLQGARTPDGRPPVFRFDFILYELSTGNSDDDPYYTLLEYEVVKE
jgi:hypothetical protein